MRRRLILVVLVLGVFLLGSMPAHSSDWLTAGGGSDRANRSTAPIGTAFPNTAWTVSPMEPGMEHLTNFGASAAQPIAVMRSGSTYLFHLSGRYLWRLNLKPDGSLQEVKELNGGEWLGYPVNPDQTTPFSTPSYSQNTETLYFGSNDGVVFGYNVAAGTFRFQRVTAKTDGCRIIASPLILQVGGREVVVVGDRPQDDRTNCGSVWVVWGLDGSGEPDHTSYEGNDFGGWITPSPISIPGSSDAFIIGADGACKGSRMIRLRVMPDGERFKVQRDTRFDISCTDAPSGFAGSFAADLARDTFYWLDTKATLWGARISSGEIPERWAQRSIDLPPHVAGAHGATSFTNTAPAIGSDGTVYVTLRNFANAGEQLRGCAGLAPTAECTLPGAPGAVLAISPSGQVLWGHRQGKTEGTTYPDAINTDPLLLETGLLLYGDVNGALHARSLETGLPATLTLSDGCDIQALSSLLKPGEKPGGGTRTYSQTFGVGIAPMVTAPLIVTGVNVEQGGTKFHRLVGIAARSVYNLAWQTPFPSEPLQPDATGHLRISGQVLLEVGRDRLSQLRPNGVAISWYIIPEKTWERFETRALHAPGPEARYLTESLLPELMTVGEVTPLDFAFTPDDRWPAEGYLLGVIDVEQLRLHLGLYEATFASWLANAKGSIAKTCPPGASEMARVKRGDTFYNALRDNYLLVPFRLATDLSISLEVPSSLPGERLAQYEHAYITVTNHGPVPVGVQGTDIKLYAAWPGVVAEQPVGGQQILLGVGETKKLAIPFQVMNCNGSGTLRATVNATKTTPETNWSNNSASATVQVGPCSKTSPKTTPSDRPTRTIIVPPDCIPDTDPKSRRLCTNYPKELYNW